MPHQGTATLSVGLAVGGLAGVAYGCSIGVNMWHIATRETRYVPVREDWIWNVILPTVAYIALTVMAVLLWEHLTHAALYGVAMLVLALLLMGVRNAWDLVVWISMSRPQDEPPGRKE